MKCESIESLANEIDKNVMKMRFKRGILPLRKNGPQSSLKKDGGCQFKTVSRLSFSN